MLIIRDMAENNTSNPALDERYEVKGILGKGGMGIVYQVFDRILGLDVAIKMLKADSMGMASVRLQREAIAAGKMQNANIARVFDFGQTADGSPYMVMEMVQGKSLSELISQSGAIEYKKAIDIFKQICNGLEHAHSNNIIHRDLKPSNVMLVKQDNAADLVKLLDFGVAKLVADQKVTSTGAIVGSPMYMSPEQVQAAEVDFRSDLYSLGCLMFETLSGRPPFQGNSAIETMSLHKNVAPPLVSEITPNEIPPELANLIDQCMRKRPEDRPSSANSVKESLEQILNPAVVEITTPEKERKYIERKETVVEKLISKFSRKTALTTGGVLSLFVVTALGVSYQNYFKNDSAKNEGAIKAPTKPRETKEEALDDGIDRNPNFEYTTYDGSSAIITKKQTTDADFKDIVDFNFHVLKIKKGHVKGTGLEYISKKPLFWIDIKNSEFDCKNLKYLSYFDKLEKLELTLSSLNDSDLKEILKAKSINDLSINTGKITDEGIALLANLPKLEKLSMYDCSLVSKDVGKSIAKIKTLKHLRLSSLPSANSFKSIAGSEIDSLNVQDLTIDAVTFQQICSNPNLKELCVTNIRLDGNDYSPLTKMTNLQKLNLQFEEHFPTELMSTLTKINVPEIDFNNSLVSPKQLDIILNNPNLNTILCTNCKRLTQKDTAQFELEYFKKWKKKLIAENHSFDRSEMEDFRQSKLFFEP